MKMKTSDQIIYYRTTVVCVRYDGLCCFLIFSYLFFLCFISFPITCEVITLRNLLFTTSYKLQQGRQSTQLRLH